jgi:hypothetical protein
MDRRSTISSLLRIKLKRLKNIRERAKLTEKADKELE